MTINGYVLVPRTAEDLFGNINEEPLCRRGAWHWLFDKAAWREDARWNGKASIKLKRGELCCSLRFLAQAWGWSHGKVQRWLSVLADRGMVALRRCETGQLIITLLGYDRVSAEPSSESAKPRPRQAESGGRESAASHQPSQSRINESSDSAKRNDPMRRDAPPVELPQPKRFGSPHRPAPTKENIKGQLFQKLCRYLKARGKSGELQSFMMDMMGDDPRAAQKAFDLVDARRKAERWDDHGGNVAEQL